MQTTRPRDVFLFTMVQVCFAESFLCAAAPAQARGLLQKLTLSDHARLIPHTGGRERSPSRLLLRFVRSAAHVVFRIVQWKAIQQVLLASKNEPAESVTVTDCICWSFSPFLDVRAFAALLLRFPCWPSGTERLPTLTDQVCIRPQLSAGVPGRCGAQSESLRDPLTLQLSESVSDVSDSTSTSNSELELFPPREGEELPSVRQWISFAGLSSGSRSPWRSSRS
jgi:hypothetical protein